MSAKASQRSTARTAAPKASPRTASRHRVRRSVPRRSRSRRHAVESKNASAKPDGKAAPLEDATSGNIDKVRDILFGGQMRDYDRRFARLEERLAAGDGRAEGRRPQAPDGARAVRQAGDRVARRSHQDRARRADRRHEGSRARGARQRRRRSRRRPASSTTRSARCSASCASRSSSCTSSMTDDLRQKIDEVLRGWHQESTELRNDKTDRATLAALLTEMAHAPHQRAVDPRRRPRSERMIGAPRAVERRRSRRPDLDEICGAARRCSSAPSSERLAALQARLDDREARAEDVGEVLPQVLLQHAHDPHFARALTPPLEKAHHRRRSSAIPSRSPTRCSR